MTSPNAAMQAVLDEHARMGPLPIESLTPDNARLIPLPDRAAVAVYGHHITKKALAPLPLPVGKVEHKTIPGPGGDIMIRIYTPRGDAPQAGWPVLVYYHGGGWVIADLDTYDSSARALCDGAGCIVVSSHYRQAPEHKWPAARDDAFVSYKWTCDHAASLNGDPANIAIAGESAGGNLATVVALMAKSKAVQSPVHQLLVYPVTDIANGAQSDSAQEFMNAKPLNTPMLRWFYNHYLPEGADAREPTISPLYAANLSDLPPATIILAEIDPLRSDGLAYARKLEEAGVPVDHEIYAGVTHEFFGMAGIVPEAGKAIAHAVKNLKKAFAESRDKPFLRAA